MMTVIPSVLLGSGLTATATNHAWGEDWGSYGGQAGPGAYSLGYSAGISDAVYDHDNSLAYNPVGNCLPCHSQVWVCNKKNPENRSNNSRTICIGPRISVISRMDKRELGYY